MFPQHYELHRHLIERERELLEKRAEYEAQVDAAAAAAKAARKEQAVARASGRPVRRIGAFRPMHWLKLRLAQS